MNASKASAAADATPKTEPVTDEVMTLLTEQGIGDDSIRYIREELGATSVADLALLTEADLAMAGLKTIQARKLVATFAPAVPDAAGINTVAIDNMLPSVPSDESWLDSLRTGGILKVDSSTVIAAIRAALATRVGLFDVPDKLVREMELYAEKNEEQVDASAYFPLRDQLTRRTYGDLFNAIPGLNGSYVTEPRKKVLFARIDEHLWPAIIAFYGQLKSWQESWAQGASNPMLLLGLLAGQNAGGAMPPGMIQPPATTALRDHAEAVADASNKVFAGTGVQIASAVAYNAAEIKKSLEDPRLPALVGAGNRDQMLKQLGVAVNATYPRLEQNLTRFVLSTLQVEDQPTGPEELQYFSALYMLGSQISWDQLGGGHVLTGIGGPNRL